MLRFTERPRELALILYGANVPAGFPSPADDHVDRKLDLNEHLIRRPAATYFVRADGDSMRDAGIFSGDLLIVDRGVQPKHGDVVIAVIHGDLTVKRLSGSQKGWHLVAANPSFADIPMHDTGSEIWGVVTHSIRQHCDR